jgi:hypothetical protein
MLSMGIRQRIAAALLGVSTYQAATPSAGATTLDAPSVEAIRKLLGGQLAPMPTAQTRWYLADLEDAEHAASSQGDLSGAARLMRAAGKDGILAGVMSTRTSGLVRLPKRFRGDPEIVAELELGHEAESGEVRSVFDEMFPPQELALLAKDGIELGVGVGELVPVEGRDYPVLVRLNPEYLIYRWAENRWYYRSIVGLIAITPGDGRWILHTPGGRQAPWENGQWRALGAAFIRKEHAKLHKDNWEGKLANPARVAVSPQGASEEHSQAWFQAVLAWGINSVFGVTPGYDVKLLESNGRGWESFNETIKQSDLEYTICLAGQTVTTDGGTGFANADIHKSIRADLIEATEETLAYTINTQGLPAFIVARWGEERLASSVVMGWDVTPPKDRAQEATSMQVVAGAITTLSTALAQYGRTLDIDAMCSRFGIPVAGDVDGDGKPDTDEQPAGLTVIQGGKSGPGDEDEQDDDQEAA